MNTELPHLRELENATPRTAMGRVVAAWSVIGPNLATGKKLWEVWEAAERDGLDVPYPLFKIYVQRLRKRDHRRPMLSIHRQTMAQAVQATESPSHRGSQAVDPLRNLREQRAKAKGFEYDPFPRKGLTR